MAVTTTPSASTSTPAPVRAPITGAGQTSFRRETPAASVVNPVPATPPAAAEPPAGDPATPKADAGVPPAPADGTPATEPKPEDDPKFAAKFSALAKREREIVTREQTLKARETQLADYEKARASGKLNPLDLLKEHGWSYDQLTQLVLNDGKLTSDQELRIIKEQQQKDAENAQTQAEKDQVARVEQAVADHKAKLKEHVDSNAEKFKFIRAQPESWGYDLVYSVQDEHYGLTAKANGGKGEILSFDQAAEKVESYLSEQFKQQQAKVAPQEKAPETQVAPPATGYGGSPARNAPATLTNSVHATAAPAPQTRGKVLSPEESKREAAKLLRWT